jgi:hypothetical protein
VTLRELIEMLEEAAQGPLGDAVPVVAGEGFNRSEIQSVLSDHNKKRIIVQLRSRA